MNALLGPRRFCQAGEYRRRELRWRAKPVHALIHVDKGLTDSDTELFDWVKFQGANEVGNVQCFHGPSGERGLAAVRDFPPGSDVFELPLELAICEWPGEQAFPGTRDAPGSVRLASKLLHLMAAAGLLGEVEGQKDNPAADSDLTSSDGVRSTGTDVSGASGSGGGGGGGWGPYLRSLPRHPPAMLLSFTSPADLDALEYPPIQRAVRSYRGLAAQWYGRAGGGQGGLGGASLEQFTWALAIVGSRSLAANMLLLAMMALPGAPPEAPNLPHEAGAAPAACRAAPAIADPTAPESHSGAAASATDSAAPGPAAAPTAEAPTAAAAGVESATLQLLLLTLAGTQRLTAPGLGPMAPTAAEPVTAPSIGAGDASRPMLAVDTTAAVATASGQATASPTSAVSMPSGTGSGTGSGGFGGAGGELRMLVPLLDLMNHRGARRVGGRLADGGGSSGTGVDGARAAAAREGCSVVGEERILWEANVRWELRPPVAIAAANDVAAPAAATALATAVAPCPPPQASAPQPRSGWRVAVVATAHVAAGEELCLSYDATGSNDAFALHYGFVPPFNPYDDVYLYDSLAEATTWLRADAVAAAAAEVEEEEADVKVVTSSRQHGGSTVIAATTEEQASDDAAGWAAAGGGAGGAPACGKSAAAGASGETAGAVAEGPETEQPVKLYPGGRVCPRLAAALRQLYAGRDELAAAAVRRRCLQLLAATAPLLQDLELLLRALQTEGRGSSQANADANGSLRSSRFSPGQGSRNGEQATAARASGQRVGTGGCQSCGAGNGASMELDVKDRCGRDDRSDRTGGEAAASGEAASWAALLRHYRAALEAQPPELQAVAGLGPAPAPPTPPPTPHGPTAETSAACQAEISSGACSSPQDQPLHSARSSAPLHRGGGHGVDAELGGEMGARGPRLGLPLSQQRRLALVYRTYKKMLLWDYVLGHEAPVSAAT